MTEQVLPILETDTGRSKTATKSVLKIVDANLGKIGAFTRLLPGAIQHPLDRPPVEFKDVDRMAPAPRFND